jgi:hypothetical protein
LKDVGKTAGWKAACISNCRSKLVSMDMWPGDDGDECHNFTQEEVELSKEKKAIYRKI